MGPGVDVAVHPNKRKPTVLDRLELRAASALESAVQDWDAVLQVRMNLRKMVQ